MTNPYVVQMRQWRQTLTKDQRWAILISADPDALASALALKRIMAHRVRGVDIFRINEVTRPNNLAMIRYLRIPAKLWQPEKADLYTNFAMVDSQPHHNPAFQGITFDLIIDHHPLTAGQLPQAPFCDIRPGFGATSTMMTRYLQGLRIKPGPLLSTALLYGIRTDTATFERSGGEDDLRAYHQACRRHPAAPHHPQRIPARLAAPFLPCLPLPAGLPGRGHGLAQRGGQRRPAGGRGRLFHPRARPQVDRRLRRGGKDRGGHLPR